MTNDELWNVCREAVANQTSWKLDESDPWPVMRLNDRMTKNRNWEMRFLPVSNSYGFEMWIVEVRIFEDIVFSTCTSDLLTMKRIIEGFLGV